MTKPKVNLKCVANHYAATNERIIEFSHKNKGGLISFRELEDGTLMVDIYRTDEGVRVLSPPNPSIKELEKIGACFIRQNSYREYKYMGKIFAATWRSSLNPDEVNPEKRGTWIIWEK